MYRKRWKFFKSSKAAKIKNFNSFRDNCGSPRGLLFFCVVPWIQDKGLESSLRESYINVKKQLRDIIRYEIGRLNAWKFEA